MNPRTVVLTLVLASASVWGSAQDRAIISGDCVDAQDTPVRGVQITLRNESLRITRTTTTDSDGLYLFAEVVPAEGYVIKAAAPGLTMTPPQVKFSVEVGEMRHLLPSFIAQKAPATTSSLRRRRSPDVAARQGQVSGTSIARPAPLMVAYLSPRQAPAYESVADGDPQMSTQDRTRTQDKASAAAQAAPAQAPAPQARRRAAGVPHKPASKAGTQETSTVPLDSISTAISTVITSSELRSLPLFNRNFLAVGLLVPSTHDVEPGSDLKDTTFSISGQRPTSNAFLLDGMDNEASSSNQAIPFQVNDAIQEFRVVTANSDAEFGRNIGGVVNIVTRRGTAKFHGSVFGFFANSSMDASSPLSVYNGSGFDQAAAFAGPVDAPPAVDTNQAGFPVIQPNSYNQYVSTIASYNATYGTNFCAAPGATLGSPGCLQSFDSAAVLAQNNSHIQPLSSQQFGTDAGGSLLKRWYWFGDYEGTRVNNPNPIFDRVPSSFDRSRLGEFQTGTSGYQDAQFAQSVLSLFPKSNVVAIPGVLEFYRGYAPNYTNVDNYLGRIDFTPSDRSDWTFRYNLQDLAQLHDDTLPSSPVYPGNGAQRAVLNQNLAATFTHFFSDRLSNVLRGGFSRFQVQETPQDANFNSAKAGLPSGAMQTYLLSGLDPQYAGAAPGVNGAWSGWWNSFWSECYPTCLIEPSLDGLFPFARIGAPLSAPGARRDSELQFTDNLEWFRGRHTLRAGFDLRQIQNFFDNSGFSRGLVVSSDIGEFTSDSETGDFSNPSFDYAIKQPSSFNTALNSYAIAGYLQDSWRARPNLTINAGLRYEYFSPPLEANQQLWNYDPVANGLVQEGETRVVNPFGIPCGDGLPGYLVGSPIYLEATLPSSVFGGVGQLWQCNATGNGNFLVASKTNFEPRIGIAWSSASGDTVVRAGFGIFYDEIPASLIAQLAFNRPVLFNALSPQTIYGQNTFGVCSSTCGMGNSTLLNGNLQSYAQAASTPFAPNAVDPSNQKSPQTRQVNVSVGRQITPFASAEVDYIGNFMANLPTTANTGFNHEWFCDFNEFTDTGVPSGQGPPCDSFSQSPVFTHANLGSGNYNAFVAKLTTRGWHGFQARASYTYSKALDNASSASSPIIPAPVLTQVLSLGQFSPGNPLSYAIGTGTGYPTLPGLEGPGSLAASFAALTSLLTQGISTTGAGQAQVTPYTLPQDPYHFLRNDHGPSDFNQTHRFILDDVWEVPASKPSQLRAGWMLSGVLIAQGGQPFTIFSGPVGGELTQRVNLSGPLKMTGNPNAYIGNTASIALPGAACSKMGAAYSPYVIQPTVGLLSGSLGVPCLGNSGRNQFTGPGYVDYDAAIQKSFPIEKTTLSVRAESYNLFNHPNYDNPISSYSLDGVSPYSQFGEIKSAHPARQFQFAARMSW
jgi:hypothetical protein